MEHHKRRVLLWNYFNFVGSKFRSLTTLDMFVGTWNRGFQIICNIIEVYKYFFAIKSRGLPNSRIHEIKCPTNINDFTEIKKVACTNLTFVSTIRINLNVLKPPPKRLYVSGPNLLLKPSLNSLLGRSIYDSFE